MIPLKTIAALLALPVALFCCTTTASAAEKTKTKELIDFTRQNVERYGAEVKVIKKYGYAFGDWQDKIKYLDGRGLLVQAPGGKGGFGGDKSMKLGDYDALFLVIVVGNANAGRNLGLTLTDADGTEASWSFPLADKPRGVGLVCQMALAKPDKIDKPGKTSGLDKTKITKWQVRGDWQTAGFEVLVMKLGAMTTP